MDGYKPALTSRALLLQTPLKRLRVEVFPVLFWGYARPTQFASAWAVVSLRSVA